MTRKHPSNTEAQSGPAGPAASASDGPRIYVACLAAYNSGILHGRWIDADKDADSLFAEVSAMLRASPASEAEEWVIHDYEGFEGAPISEYCSMTKVAAIAAFVVEHGKLGGALLAHFSGDLEDAEAALEDYAGDYASLADLAEELTRESTAIPKNLDVYIDYEAMARDMALSGDVFTLPAEAGRVHVFWSR
ncbi:MULTISPECIES: antirestriction protein ArdA [Kordiimonas]|jgi:antirestriction protein|uniref:antirestriction protein ArdA n=1 Tax=Kordiimonas TaxID=288021 RepID=UPI00257BA558|nr:antirestriction protein ArdA [Kordiimonas sp. UBA4487]